MIFTMILVSFLVIFLRSYVVPGVGGAEHFTCCFFHVGTSHRFSQWQILLKAIQTLIMFKRCWGDIIIKQLKEADCSDSYSYLNCKTSVLKLCWSNTYKWSRLKTGAPNDRMFPNTSEVSQMILCTLEALEACFVLRELWPFRKF